MRPGLKFKVEGTPLERLDFLSLMLALFLGTAALPHILIRYYTVPNSASARKSTIVAIAAIGAFYILTLYMGLGAMTSGVINPADSNMSAPLLARSFGELLFAVISAIAFATILGTVSGLIVAASGAIAHDLFDRFFTRWMTARRSTPARSRRLSSAGSPSCLGSCSRASM
jgi:cation/acetate symporter